MTPAGTSNELDVQNEWEENTHTVLESFYSYYEYHVWSHIHVCLVTHIARVWINRVRLPILHARGQLNRENEYFPVRVVFVPENLVSRDGFGSPVPRQPAHLHTHQAESGAHLRAFVPENLVSRDGFGSVPSRVSLLISIIRLNLVLTYYGISPEFRHVWSHI